MLSPRGPLTAGRPLDIAGYRVQPLLRRRAPATGKNCAAADSTVTHPGEGHGDIPPQTVPAVTGLRGGVPTNDSGKYPDSHGPCCLVATAQPAPPDGLASPSPGGLNPASLPFAYPILSLSAC